MARYDWPENRRKERIRKGGKEAKREGEKEGKLGRRNVFVKYFCYLFLAHVVLFNFNLFWDFAPVGFDV